MVFNLEVSQSQKNLMIQNVMFDALTLDILTFHAYFQEAPYINAQMVFSVRNRLLKRQLFVSYFFIFVIWLISL